MVSWFYVDGSQKVGPLDSNRIEDLIKGRKLNADSYLWRKGLENWTKLKEIEDFRKLESSEKFDWTEYDPNKKEIYVRVSEESSIYGPYNLEILKDLFKEKRINEESLVFISGMENWVVLGSTPLGEKIGAGTIEDLPPEKRSSIRRPFVARIFIHDDRELYEGLCRDISIGGLQILVSNFPGKKGDLISINAHPENDTHNFVAQGQIVRLLDGQQGVSVRFKDLTKEARSSIEAYLNDGDGD